MEDLPGPILKTSGSISRLSLAAVLAFEETTSIAFPELRDLTHLHGPQLPNLFAAETWQIAMRPMIPGTHVLTLTQIRLSQRECAPSTEITVETSLLLHSAALESGKALISLYLRVKPVHTRL